jgi:hypothetical protein
MQLTNSLLEEAMRRLCPGRAFCINGDTLEGVVMLDDSERPSDAALLKEVKRVLAEHKSQEAA